jgi:hypothetical protein
LHFLHGGRFVLSEKRAAIGSSKQAQQLKELIARGKEQGFLTYAEVNDHLPNDIIDPEQIEDIVNMINDMGITVHEKAPDDESLLLSDAAVSNDDDAAEEAEPRLPVWTPNSAARRTRYACTCVKWGPWNC